ncbi:MULTISPECIES: hypothetical protein [unclassified Agarivorans]|nr:MULTISPECIES: hypothetical protein [unclassified Agarivorans]MDO6685806.1 hypothetical protein [Agarivorans sp. 3_MG-2023]MDO6716079.1 hypothetical protein [Agarivorans sp. 2_MG-2023]MDO6764244.1 hypothetical protein [Agarivorans sp. 1_MG-2023]
MAFLSIGVRVLLLVLMLGSVFSYSHASHPSWAKHCPALITDKAA